MILVRVAVLEYRSSRVVFKPARKPLPGPCRNDGKRQRHAPIALQDQQSL
jgi:hypothetical protein